MNTRKKRAKQESREGWQAIAEAIKSSSEAPRPTPEESSSKASAREPWNEIIRLVNVDEMHLVIADSKGKEVAEIEYLRKEDNQLSVIFRSEAGEVEECLTRFDVDV
jgi:hypothetical protein